MTYENSTVYKGQFAGIEVTFSLQGFSEKTVDRFNATLAEKALEHMKKEERKID